MANLDTVQVALAAGFVLSGAMALDSTLFRTTRTRAGIIAIGYILTFLVLSDTRACSAILGLVHLETVCEKLVISRQNLSQLMGYEFANQLSYIFGSIGFVLTATRTKSDKWLGIGILLMVVTVLVVLGTIAPH